MCKIRPIPKSYDELVERIYEPFAIEEMRLVCMKIGWNPFIDPVPPGMKIFTDITPQAIRNRLNECFGLGGWGFEETSERITTQKEFNGKITEKNEILCTGKLTVRWSGDGGNFERTIIGYGSADIRSGSIGDAYKSAGTAALSKAASNLGIGDEVYNGRVDTAEWLRRCREVGINSIPDWEAYRNNSGAPSSPARNAGCSSSSPVNAPHPNGGAKTPASASAGTNSDAGGRRSGNGDRPLSGRLWDVAKMLGHTKDTNALNALVKAALNIEPKDSAPRIVDIQEPANRKKVLSELIGAACAGNPAADEWLNRYGYASVEDLIRLACDGKITIENLSDLAKALDGNPDSGGPAPQRDRDHTAPSSMEPEHPTTHSASDDHPSGTPGSGIPGASSGQPEPWNLYRLLNSFASMRITKTQIEGALGRKISESDVSRFSRVFMAMEERPGLDLRRAMDEVKS